MQKRILYWDGTDGGNMIDVLKDVGAPRNSKHYANIQRATKCEIRNTKEYTDPGVYYVKVYHGIGVWATDHWKNPVLLQELPEHVITGMQQDKITLVIDSTTEGHSYKEYLNRFKIDVFKRIHEDCEKRNIPIHKIEIIYGDYFLNEGYTRWCESNNIGDKRLTIKWGIAWHNNTIWNKPTELAIEQAIRNVDSKDFLSLNRMYRPHRVLHFYELIDKNLLDKGIVSGGFIQGTGVLPGAFSPDIKKLFPNIPDDYPDKIEKHFPIELDECSKSRQLAEMLATHREYMQNSLLSFVTETQFYYDAWFPTEKIFKTFSFGHPFILLGSRGLVRCLKNLGFKVDLCGIDHTYDLIADPEKRAEMAHRELVKWCKLGREEKIIRIEKSMDDMRYNFELSHSLQLYEDTVLKRIFLP